MDNVGHYRQLVQGLLTEYGQVDFNNFCDIGFKPVEASAIGHSFCLEALSVMTIQYLVATSSV